MAVRDATCVDDPDERVFGREMSMSSADLVDVLRLARMWLAVVMKDTRKLGLSY